MSFLGTPLMADVIYFKVNNTFRNDQQRSTVRNYKGFVEVPFLKTHTQDISSYICFSNAYFLAYFPLYLTLLVSFLL